MPDRSLAERLLFFTGKLLGRIVYRVEVLGASRLPSGGCLLLPNHITWVDAVVLQIACPRPIRFIIDESFYRQRLLHQILKTAGCIPIIQKKPRSALRAAADALHRGEIVCVFPEGQLSRTGTLTRLQRGYQLITSSSKVPAVPVWLDRLWGSIFSFRRGRFFTKWPERFPYKVTVAFGSPLPPDSADVATLREKLLLLGAECYERRPILRRHLAAECVRGLKRKRFANAIIDGTDGSELSRGKLLGAALALSRHLKRSVPGKRVGIVLPSSKAAVVANLAVTLAGKIPVGLNFTAGSAALKHAIKSADLDCVISARAFRSRIPEFPWPENTIWLDELLPTMKKRVAAWWLAALLLPRGLLVRCLRLPSHNPHDEAVLLFTSGSSGEPKGVVLSHRNILGNVSQFSVMLDARDDDAILASLPFFHSFGCTVTLWYPLIESVKIVTYPNPLDAAKNAELIERYRATVILATPTFLRAYLRKAQPEQLRSARLVIVGAEKMPLDLAASFEARFGKRVFEGYGLTETSPVVSVNLPDPIAERGNVSAQSLYRLGSVGKMAAGIAAQIRDPDTNEHRSLHESGMLWLRGPNIFEGYLGDEARTREVLQDGWFKSGDIGRLDEDGFLYIEGRVSRFSKIGGEMVSHEAVEQKIIAALGLDGDSERRIAVVGIPDENKGEALVVLSAVPIALDQLRNSLKDAGLTNLWIPKQVRLVDAIPVLASGKLDITRCGGIATRGES